MIPEAVHAWARDRLDRDLVAVRPVTGGATDSVHLLSLADAPPVLLRWVPGLDPAAARPVGAEATGCLLMADRDLPAPRLLASTVADPELGGSANLTSWLPGEVDLQRPTPFRISDLARAAVVIHGGPAPASGRRPAPFARWGPAEPQVPAWTGDPGRWRAALDLLAAGPPPTRATVIHRDFHPGNLLWSGPELTGVIDWAETSWGPADADVAHCRSNFFLLWDVGAAEAFTTAYLRAGGALHLDPTAAAYWQVVDVVGFLPSPEDELADLLRRRPDLGPVQLRDRLDALLAWILRSLD